MGKFKSPEESGRSATRAPRGGAGREWDGGGFPEGQNGRGPTPYKKSHSAKPASLESHSATSGRGGEGQFGKADGFKGNAADIQHPGSHAEFEQLGADGD